MKAVRLAKRAASAQANAMARLLDGGTLAIFDTEIPPDNEDGPGIEEAVTVSHFGQVAAPDTTDGKLRFHPILCAHPAEREGIARWFRAYTRTGLPVIDGSCGKTGSGADLELAQVRLRPGAKPDIIAFTYTIRRTL